MTKLVEWLFSFIPTALPITEAQFERWADSVMRLKSPAVPDNRSTRFALYAMILHIKPECSRVPKNHFVKALNRAGSNETAYKYMEALKQLQKADNAKEEAEKAGKEYKEKTGAENVVSHTGDLVKNDSSKPKLAVVPGAPTDAQ